MHSPKGFHQSIGSISVLRDLRDSSLTLLPWLVTKKHLGQLGLRKPLENDDPFLSLGFLVNYQKSNLAPAQIVKFISVYLGYVSKGLPPKGQFSGTYRSYLVSQKVPIYEGKNFLIAAWAHGLLHTCDAAYQISPWVLQIGLCESDLRTKWDYISTCWSSEQWKSLPGHLPLYLKVSWLFQLITPSIIHGQGGAWSPCLCNCIMAWAHKLKKIICLWSTWLSFRMLQQI